MEVVNKALTLCVDYKEAHHNHFNPSSSKLRWQPSDLGDWKLNVDRAIFPDHHHAGVDLVLRDDKGHVPR